MTGDVVTISGYTPNHQKREAKPTSEFDLSADSHSRAVQHNQENSPGPAYILQLSKEAQEILAKQRK